MISGDIHQVERLAIRAGILAMRLPYDTKAVQEQHLLFTRGMSSLIAIFADHNHSEESAAIIREDLADAILLVPGLRDVAEAVAAVVELRTPIPAPARATETPLLLRIGAVAAEEAIDLYPHNELWREISTVVVYCALIVYGPVGAELPWRDLLLAGRVRRRVSRVPSLLDAPERDR